MACYKGLNALLENIHLSAINLDHGVCSIEYVNLLVFIFHIFINT